MGLDLKIIGIMISKTNNNGLYWEYHWDNNWDFSNLGVSENVVYPIVPNGFADHYPY